MVLVQKRLQKYKIEDELFDCIPIYRRDSRFGKRNLWSPDEKGPGLLWISMADHAGNFIRHFPSRFMCKRLKDQLEQDRVFIAAVQNPNSRSLAHKLGALSGL